jgi:3-(3-hydroxy-phenyl)propionate hydroxylase
MIPGAPAADAPVRVGSDDDWFLFRIGGEFDGVYFSDNGRLPAATASALRSLAQGAIPVRTLVVVPSGAKADKLPGIAVVEDAQGMLAQRFDGRDGTYYLLRPDQHVSARWREFNPDWARAAVARATCNA